MTTKFADFMQEIETEAFKEGPHAVADMQNLHKVYGNKRRTAQVDKLAKELGCRIDYLGYREGMMYVEFGYVEGPKIQNQIDYLICLHELGHFAWGHTQGRPPASDKKFYFENGVLKSEAQAWEWALDHCQEEITDESRKFMWDNCLGTYYQGAVESKGRKDRLGNGNRHHVEFVWDKPDEYFHSIVARITEGIKELKIPKPSPAKT